MKKVTAFALISAVFIIAGCGNNQNSENTSKTKKAEVKKERKINILETKEGLETRLKEIGLLIYPGAKFNSTNTSNSTFDGGHHILYDLPEATEESKAKVAKFYDDIFKNFKNDGWKNPHNLW